MGYALTGILAFMAAFDMGGEKAGKLHVIEILGNQAFGKWLVILLGLGLLCYATCVFYTLLWTLSILELTGKVL
jgi:hypothetical protein